MTLAVEQLTRALLRRRAPELQATVGELVMMANIEKGLYYGLNPSAARVWELLEAETSFDALCAQLVEEFEIDARTCRTHVTVFLQKLDEQGMLEVMPTGS